MKYSLVKYCKIIYKYCIVKYSTYKVYLSTVLIKCGPVKYCTNNGIVKLSAILKEYGLVKHSIDKI